MNWKRRSLITKALLLLALIGSLSGFALSNYHVDTIRARRLVIEDADGVTRIVMVVHEGVPAVTFYGVDGQPQEPRWVAGAGLLISE